jgi:uncharacterized protein
LSLYFLDSSALVKRYVTEIGSEWIKSVADPSARHTLIVARITWVETISAFARLKRENTLLETDLDLTIRTFQFDWHTQYQIVEVDAFLTQLAGKLLLNYPLRAYDSIQLAAALKLLPAIRHSSTPYTFVTADDRLLSAAQAEGLQVCNPNRQ